MPRNQTLETLLYNLRAEVGQSTNPAISRSSRNRHIALLNGHQRRLYINKAWDFLKIDRDIKLEQGSRYYDFPTDIDIDRVDKIEVKWGGTWQPVKYGIDGEHLDQFDSDIGDENDPVLRWKFHLEDGATVPQIEVWPIPAGDGVLATKELYLRVSGVQKLVDMVSDNDTCLLDGDLLVYYTAAEILTKRGSRDAQAKLEKANKLLGDSKSRAVQTRVFQVGGDCTEDNEKKDIELRAVYAGQE